MAVLEDRVPGKPGRVLVTPEDGGEAFYATLELADEPVVAGNKVNRQNVIDTATAVHNAESVAAYRKVIFEESGTFTVPDNAVNDEFWVFLAGGGGGGGGGTIVSDDDYSPNASSGSGCNLAAMHARLVPGTIFNIVVGAGGAGGTRSTASTFTGVAGSAGGQSEFYHSSSAKMTAAGGTGGNPANTSYRGADGVGPSNEASVPSDLLSLCGGEIISSLAGGTGASGGGYAYYRAGSKAVGGNGGNGGTFGGGGGGGNASGNTTGTGTGGNGGNGGTFGGGGGGGSAEYDDSTGGTGGIGGTYGGNGGNASGYRLSTSTQQTPTQPGNGTVGMMYYDIWKVLPVCFSDVAAKISGYVAGSHGNSMASPMSSNAATAIAGGGGGGYGGVGGAGGNTNFTSGIGQGTSGGGGGGFFGSAAGKTYYNDSGDVAGYIRSSDDGGGGGGFFADATTSAGAGFLTYGHGGVYGNSNDTSSNVESGTAGGDGVCIIIYKVAPDYEI